MNTDWEKEFDKKFDNYAYIAELYVEAQMGDLNLLSLKDFIRNLLTSQRAELVGRVEALIVSDKFELRYTNSLIEEVLALLQDTNINV